MTLTDGGYHVFKAEDGVAAHTIAQGTTVDLVITDLNMPRMDGMELIKQLRSMPTYRYVPILVLTTEGDAERRALAKQVGASGWLMKPFEPKKLLGAVTRLAG